MHQKTSISDEFIWYGKLLENYGILNEYVTSHGAKMFNATSSTIVENVPRIDLKEVLK